MAADFTFQQTNQTEVNYPFLLSLVAFTTKSDDCVWPILQARKQRSWCEGNPLD